MNSTSHESRKFMEPNEQVAAPLLSDDSIVVSGMSGMFPSAKSIKEFSEILYSKVNPVNKDMRWNLKHPEVTEYLGSLADVDRFDAQFFMVHKRLGDVMDPMARKLLEQSYQAIYDAGLNPKHLNGKKVGVYIAATFSDTEKLNLMENKSFKKGYCIIGSSKSMFANRISYWLNAKGPSMTVDDACCGSIVALEEAFKAMNSGIIEGAIVGGTNLYLDQNSLVHYNRCIKISPDGKTKSFDQNADGCAISEAISVLFLQKAKHAVRAYAEVVHVKNEFISKKYGESGEIFGFMCNPDINAKFLRNIYEEALVLPKDVKYIEACGSATPEADKAELQSIEKVFCENRPDALLVGSVMSNVGFSDAASGTSAITKVLLGYHNCLIASNLHCEKPRQDIPALQDGRMSIVTEHQPFHGTYAAVNCLSFTGVNSHVLLRGCSKPKDLAKYKTSMPRLLTISARHEEHLKDLFEDLKSRPIDAEELALLQNIHTTTVSGHLGRGYVILDTDEVKKTVSLSESTEHFDKISGPLWFVYSGMGSQWAGMGAQLMRIPIFAAAIERCHTILKPKGIDIVHIITSPDKTIFNNVLNSFVGIAAIQIGITDVLTALELRPDNIIGHSVGELGCAYADGCLTTEEIILSAYSRGKSSNEGSTLRGSMAAIGLGYQEISKFCPPSIDVACHNSSSSSTISGPEESVRDFVATLVAKGIFAKEVPCANIAYHSRYIAQAGPRLLQLLSDVIRNPKARSERWFSTSVPQDRWNEPAAKYCSAEYLTNNLVSPVLFEETCKLIPTNAVLIEVAPHGLLQAILKRALPESCKNIPLTQRGHKNNTQFLLDAIGKLYIEGYNPQVQAIYPKVEFPVSTGTPHLAHQVKWNHSESWLVEKSSFGTKLAASSRVLINIHDDEHSYLIGNVVREKNIYPFAGALVLVWDTLAMTLGFSKKKVSVRLHDVHLYSQPMLRDQKQLVLKVSLQRGSGQFEVLDGDSKVTTGFIETILMPDLHNFETTSKFDFGSDEIYEHLSSRGYSYKGDFQSIDSMDESMTAAQIVWNDNWVTFIDGLLQMNALRCKYEGVSQPTHIRDLTIDVDKHAAIVQQNLKTKIVIEAKVDEIYDCTRSGGILLQNLKFDNLPTSDLTSFDLIDSSSSSVDKSTVKIRSTNKLIYKNNFKLQIGNVCDFDTLHWEEAPTNHRNGLKVLVEYAAINMSDVNRATGVISYEDSTKYYGMDFSGFTERGKRVMGLVRNGAASTVVSAQPELLWPVPAHWTLEEAATVPLAYTQAFYYLFVKNELQRGWKVLIHGAAGALGQAAISIALAHGCKVFATVSDGAKKKFLLKLFPELNADAIANSRDDSFGDLVLNATNGEGCNIILSCVRDELKNISLKCAAFSGVTIDMVQIQSRDKFKYGMFNMTRQRSYIAADFYSIFDSGKTSEFTKLQMLISDGIARGYVSPLSRVTFAPTEAARAFRLLAASRHRGRVLLRIKELTSAQPRIVCSPDSMHLIVWDGGSYGLQLADRLISRGAKKLRILSLSSTSIHLFKLRLWKIIGVDVDILSLNLSDSNAVFKLLNITSLQSPIEGIYVVVTEEVLSVKQNVKVAKIIDDLDTASRKLQLVLKYFAVITIDSTVGQKTCLSRCKNGLSAVTLILPGYKKENDSVRVLMGGEFSWNRAAINVADLAFSSKHPILFAQSQALKNNFLEKIISAKTENDDDDNTLKDLGMEEFLPSIQYLLKGFYHISLSDTDAMMLTKKKLQQMELGATEHKFKEVKGLRIFFSLEDRDELYATADTIPMNTMTCNFEWMMGAIDASRPQLFIVPGLEGHHERFRALCERLKLPAFVLQPGLDRPHETPSEVALRYSKILMEQFKIKTNFYLLGYEFGIVTALELASILEKNGLTGTIYCIGDGPDEMKQLLEMELSSLDSEAALQEELVKHTYALMTRDSVASLQTALNGCSTWDARVDTCVRNLFGRVPQTAQYIRALLEAMYAGIVAARSPEAAAPRALRSRLVLLRARREGDRTRDTCSLQRYSRQPLLVRDLAAPMAHAATDLRASAIINKYLCKDLLQEYEASNMCDSYPIYD